MEDPSSALVPAGATANPVTTEKPLTSPATAEETHEDPQYLGPGGLLLLLLGLLLVVLMITLDSSVLATAIPRVTDQFHTIADIGWYPAAYMLTNAALQPLAGKAYTYFPLKKTFIFFVTLFEVGSLLCAVAQSSTMLVIGRAVAGMGSSGLLNGALLIIAVAAPPPRRPTLMGILMSMGGAGQIIGPLIGGVLTQHASWRGCFWVNLPIGGVTLATMLLIQFPHYQARKASWTVRAVVRDFDLAGFALFAPACIMLLLALQWGGTTHAWSSATVIGLLCGSVGAFVAFVVWEYRHDDVAMIPPSLVRMRVVYSGMLVSGFQFGATLLTSYYLPLWFQVIKAASPTMSAVYLLPSFIPQIFAAIATGALVARIGYLTPFVLFGTALTAIATGLMTTFELGTGPGPWIGYQIVLAVGRGLSTQQPVQAVQAVVAVDMLPTATAAVAWAQTFGAATIIGLGQTLFLNVLRAALRSHAPGVHAADVIDAGATNFLARLSGPDAAATRHDVREAENQAITQTFYLGMGVALVAFVFSVGIGKTRVERKSKSANKDEESATSEGRPDCNASSANAATPDGPGTEKRGSFVATG